jgi:hypothetical protein
MEATARLVVYLADTTVPIAPKFAPKMDTTCTHHAAIASKRQPPTALTAGAPSTPSRATSRPQSTHLAAQGLGTHCTVATECRHHGTPVRCGPHPGRRYLGS